MPPTDKTSLIIPFIQTQLSSYIPPTSHPNRPLLLSLSAPQGAGKTTLTTHLSPHLTALSIPHVLLSLDDFYLPDSTLQEFYAAHPTNPLLRHRGPPGTHDIPLLLSVLSSLAQARETAIPLYDKALNNGRGDRLPPSQWPTVNKYNTPPIRLIIFEGWSVGFQSIDPSLVSSRAASPNAKSLSTYQLEHLQEINTLLKPYGEVTEQFDAFVQMEALNLDYVYLWRAEAERKLREDRGSGMSDEAVRRFIDGYYPVYELYLEDLANGLLPREPGGPERNMKIVLGKDRQILDVTYS